MVLITSSLNIAPSPLRNKEVGLELSEMSTKSLLTPTWGSLGHWSTVSAECIILFPCFGKFMPTHVILMEAANIFTEVVSQATVASLRLHILPKPAQMDQFCSSFELQAREPKTLTLLVTK